MKGFLFLLVLAICIRTSYAQEKTGDPATDSLLAVLKSSKEDTNKVMTQVRIAREFANHGDFELAVNYGKKALALAGSLKTEKGTVGWHRGMVKAYTEIGSAFYQQGKFNISIENLQSALNILEADKDSLGMCKSYGNFAMIHVRQGNYDKAIEYYNKALKINIARNDQRNTAGVYINMGQVYTDKGDFAKAMTNIMGSMKVFTALGDKRGMATAYQSLGNLFIYQYKYDKAIENYFEAIKVLESGGEKEGIINLNSNIAQCYASQNKYDKALEMHLRSLKIARELNDKEGLSICFNNLGAAYNDLDDQDKALENYFAALKIAEETGNNGMISSLYSNIAGVYSSQKKDDKALEYYLLAVKMQEADGDIEESGRTYNLIGNLLMNQGKAGEAKKYLLKSLSALQETGAKNLIKSAYENLALCDSALGNYKGAFEYYKLFKQFNDSVFNAESSGKMDELMGKFETEKKEAQIKLLEKEKEKQAAVALEESRRQRMILYFTLGGLVLFILFSGFIFNRFKVTQKQKNIIELKEKETHQQNLIITEQKHVIEERHKEITDSINYAERIQRSFLATKEILDENLGEYFVLFKPKDVVSGDFYWAGKLKNDRFALVAADSTGHGVPGAIMSLLNITSIEAAIKDGFEDPADILNETRNTIIERLKKDGSAEGGKDGMDGSLLSFDLKNNSLRCATANNPVWIIRDGNLIEIKADRFPIGKHDRDKTPFTLHTIDLQKGDVVYSLTDGYPDQFGGADGKKFKYKKLQELLLSLSAESMSAQKQKLNAVFEEWKGNLEQVDDVTLLGVRI